MAFGSDATGTGSVSHSTCVPRSHRQDDAYWPPDKTQPSLQLLSILRTRAPHHSETYQILI